ncbi:MAG: DUF4198 domain-containing protein [Planctomycetaceae bacterium]|jgi:hypothetical protein|nr:DUF4198 domain-containing protein [Planctomycetaceae bacterium]
MNKNIFVVFLMAIMLFIVFGCNRGIERVGVEGIVTFEGKPLEGCTVMITPQAGPGAIMETDADGKYKVLKLAGPMPGECEISVEKFNTQIVDGDSVIAGPALPDKIQGKPKPFTLKSGNNTINLDLDQW